MRVDFRSPPPSLDALVELSPHEIVRRYPESLAVFRRCGVDLPDAGARPLSEVVAGRGPDEGRRLVREIGRTLAWRGPVTP